MNYTQGDRYVRLDLTQFYMLMSSTQLCDGGYYQIFNEDNVELVLLKETPFTEFTKTGIKTSDGKHREFDVIIFATGFDAMDANYMRVSIRGRRGESLQDHWVCLLAKGVLSVGS